MSQELRVATVGDPMHRVSPPGKLPRSPGTQRTVELGRGLLRSYRQAEVAAIVALLPLHLLIPRHHAARVVARLGLDGAGLASGADGRAGELDANGTLATIAVIVLGAEPRQVGDLSIRCCQ